MSQAAQVTLEDLLAAREHPMVAVESSPWLAEFLDVPDNASIPLAMSPAHPRSVGSYGAEAIAWAKSDLGVDYRWWQKLAITRQLEHDDGGALVYPEVIETGPRRIGKSVRLRGTAQWRCTMGDRIGEKQLSMLVSKDIAVGKEIHRGSWRWAEQKGWKVTRLGGAQEIENPADESRWLLRADTAVYGYDVGYGQVDESWSVDPQSITDGLEPALLERLWPQLHMTSTAHVKATSLMRRRLVAALRNADPNVLLLFWGARPGADFADPRTWRGASPYWTPEREALMARKYAAALAGQDEPEFDDPDPVRGWAAQYLNVWPLLEGRGAGIFPRWGALAVSSPPPPPLALGIAADVDQTVLSLSASSGGDRPHLGSVLRVRATDQDTFVSEVARIQREWRCVVGIDHKGPASFLLPALRLADVSLTLLGLDDFIQASAGLVTDVENGDVTHGNYEDLNAAVDAAGWRKVGERRAFARREGDISALEGAAIALHLAKLNNYDPLSSIL